MPRRYTECKDAVRAVVGRVPGASVAFVARCGGHTVAEINFGASVRRIFISSSPSDRNAFKSCARDARRALSALGANTQKGTTL